MKFISVIFLLVISQSIFSQDLGCSTIEQKFHTRYIDTTKSRGLADNYYLWDNGNTITVKFIEGGKQLHSQIEKIAKTWERFSNIKFRFITTGPSDVRVLLSTGNGHNSLIGTTCKLLDETEQTMNLDTTDFKNDTAIRSVVLHEFGHVLGLLHEHSSPISGIRWNKPVMYQSYYKTMGWGKSAVDQQVFTVFDESYTNGTTYDQLSIMHYPIASWQTMDGYSVPWNHQLSAGDKALIAALYPKQGQRRYEVPRFVLENFKEIEVFRNDQKGGLSLFPSFNITSSGKSGKVYFCVLFFDQNGYAIQDFDGNYAYGNIVAAIRDAYLLTGYKTAFNAGGQKDFEIFIPYMEIPLNIGRNDFLLQFRAVQVTEKNEPKFIYQSKPLFFSLVK